MILTNVSKRHNVGSLMRSCLAFGVSRMAIVGGGKFTTFGAQGTERYMPTEQYGKPREAVAALKARGFTICGIEITPDAQPVHKHPFRGPTAFLAGAEGEGLPEAHKALCDHFVYIPQVGNGTASLNVATACAIVLHHYSIWAGYSELPREAGKDKYAVAPPPAPKGAPGSAAAEAVRAARLAAKAAAASAAAGADALEAGGGLFEDDGDDAGGGGGGGGGHSDADGDA